MSTTNLLTLGCLMVILLAASILISGGRFELTAAGKTTTHVSAWRLDSWTGEVCLFAFGEGADDAPMLAKLKCAR